MAARWTAADDALLQDYYLAGLALREIGKRLNRSDDAVDERRRVLGIAPRRYVRPWSASEDTLVRAAAAVGIPDAEIAQRVGRSVAQVRHRRRMLSGPRTPARPYSAADDQRLRDGWREGANLVELARELERSLGSLRLRAQALGLHRPQPRRRWQIAEDAIVRDGYEQAHSCAQIARQLSGRSAGAVAARAAKLGIATYARVWTQLEDHRLRRLAAEGFRVETIAQALGRTPQALHLRARRLGIALPAGPVAPRSGRRWTATEDEVLRINGALNPAVLAEVLGRSPHAISQRMIRLRLRVGRSPHHPAPRRGALTPGERSTAVRELRSGGRGRALAVARRLDVSPAAIRAAAAQSSGRGLAAGGAP